MCRKCDDKPKCTIAAADETCCICTPDINRKDWCEECLRRNEYQIKRGTYHSIITLLKSKMSDLDLDWADEIA